MIGGEGSEEEACAVWGVTNGNDPGADAGVACWMVAGARVFFTVGGVGGS